MFKSYFCFLVFITSFGILASTNHTRWQHVDADWGYGEIGQGACDSESIRVYATGKFRMDSCGKITTGKATAGQMRELNSIMSRVMARIHKKVKCDDNQLMDYDWDIRVKSLNLANKQVYYINDDFNTCARGSNPEEGEETFYDSLDGILHEIGAPDESAESLY